MSRLFESDWWALVWIVERLRTPENAEAVLEAHQTKDFATLGKRIWKKWALHGQEVLEGKADFQ